MCVCVCVCVNVRLRVCVRGSRVTEQSFNDGCLKHVFRLDEITTINFDLPSEYFNQFLKQCAVRKDWSRVELLFLGDGGQRCCASGAGGLTANCDASEVSLSDLMKSRGKLNNLPKLLAVLIDHGALVNGICNQSPLTVALDRKDYTSAVVLLENKANVNGLLQSRISKSDDTPLHTAFRIGLFSGE